MVNIGDFRVASTSLESVTEFQEERNMRSKAADKERRAPVTTDVRTWYENPDEYDYPGVDTPSESPQLLPKDLKQNRKPATTGKASGEKPITGIDEERVERQQINYELDQRRDVSASPGELFEGIGAVGVAENTQYPNIPVQDDFGRYDLDPREEQEDIDSILGFGKRGDSAREQKETEETVMKFNEGEIGLRELGTRLMD